MTVTTTSVDSGKPTESQEKLLAILPEYSEKLKNIQDGYSHRKIYSISLDIIVGGGWSFAFIYLMYIEKMRSYSDYHAWTDVPFLLFVCAVSSSLSVIAFRYHISLRRWKHEVRALHWSLKKLVDRAIQVEDHSRLNQDERLLFAVRIAEALATLEYAVWPVANGAPISDGKLAKTQSEQRRAPVL